MKSFVILSHFHKFFKFRCYESQISTIFSLHLNSIDNQSKRGKENEKKKRLCEKKNSYRRGKSRDESSSTNYKDSQSNLKVFQYFVVGSEWEEDSKNRNRGV